MFINLIDVKFNDSILGEQRVVESFVNTASIHHYTLYRYGRTTPDKVVQNYTCRYLARVRARVSSF